MSEAPKIISVVNCLKETGKTQTCARLGKIMASYGRNTLLVDFDPHAALTGLFNLPRPVYNWYLDFKAGKDAIPRRVTDCLSVLTTGPELALADFERSLDKDFLPVAQWLQNQFLSYDVVIIDGPATTGFVAQCAAALGKNVIVPLRVDGMFLQGLKKLPELLSQPQAGRPANVITYFPRSLNINPNALQLIPPIYEYIQRQVLAPVLAQQAQTDEPEWKFLGLADYHDLFMELL